MEGFEDNTEPEEHPPRCHMPPSSAHLYCRNNNNNNNNNSKQRKNVRAHISRAGAWDDTLEIGPSDPVLYVLPLAKYKDENDGGI